MGALPAAIRHGRDRPRDRAQVATTVWSWLNEEYLTLHVGGWYAGVTVAAVIAIAMLLGWGTIAGLRVKGEPRGA